MAKHRKEVTLTVTGTRLTPQTINGLKYERIVTSSGQTITWLARDSSVEVLNKPKSNGVRVFPK